MKAWRYASGQLGLTLVSESFGTYLAFFYLEKLGLSAAFYALARGLYAIWDAVNDPLFGHLSDRTKTRWGRRRPWLFLGIPLFLLFYLLVFWVPDWAKSPRVLPYYFALAIVLYETAATVVWTNYGALFPEMFRTLPQRAQAAALKRGTELFGLILGIALAPLIYARFGFAGMALFFAGLALFAFLLFLSGVEEDPKASSPTRPSAWRGWRWGRASMPSWKVPRLTRRGSWSSPSTPTAGPRARWWATSSSCSWSPGRGSPGRFWTWSGCPKRAFTPLRRPAASSSSPWCPSGSAWRWAGRLSWRPGW